MVNSAFSTTDPTSARAPARRDVERFGGRAALGFALACFAILALGNAPFPILHDMAEAYVWGREPQLGYNQHPPFWAWVCGGWFSLMPRAQWSFAALDAINATVGLAGAWVLIGDFAAGAKRVAAFSLLLLTPIYTLEAYKFDANTILLSIWPWATHAFVVATRTRASAPAIRFGALAGLALLSKYYALLLLAACALGALATRDGRAYLRSASPWISAGVAAALFAPHAFWLATHHAPPVGYFIETSGRPWGEVARAAAASVAEMAAWFVLPAALTFAARRSAVSPRADRRLLLALALGPLALTFATGLPLGVKITSEMPVGTLALVPLVMIEVFGPADATRLAGLARRGAIAVTLAAAALAPLVMVARTRMGAKADAAAPYQEAARETTRLWRERFATPLAYVAGHGYEDFIAFYSPDRPHAFYGFNFARNLWVTPEALAARGLATVCVADDSACLADAETFATPRTVRFRRTLAHSFLGHLSDPRDLVISLTPPR